jgi:hypothetical protein
MSHVTFLYSHSFICIDNIVVASDDSVDEDPVASYLGYYELILWDAAYFFVGLAFVVYPFLYVICCVYKQL